MVKGNALMFASGFHYLNGIFSCQNESFSATIMLFTTVSLSTGALIWFVILGVSLIEGLPFGLALVGQRITIVAGHLTDLALTR